MARAYLPRSCGRASACLLLSRSIDCRATWRPNGALHAILAISPRITAADGRPSGLDMPDRQSYPPTRTRVCGRSVADSGDCNHAVAAAGHDAVASGCESGNRSAGVTPGAAFEKKFLKPDSAAEPEDHDQIERYDEQRRDQRRSPEFMSHLRYLASPSDLP